MTTNAYQIQSNLILAERGKTFSWAKFFLTHQQANAAARLYRFCRYVDDIADDTNDHQQARQTLLGFIQAIQNNTSDNEIINDAIALFQQYKIDINVPIHLIQGVISDLDYPHIKTTDDLIQYCYQVAATVGIMMCRILNVTDKRAYAHAIDLGIAMQITNICRDVKEDAELGRRYLPEQLIGKLEAHQLIQPNLQAQQQTTTCLSYLLSLADHYYASASKGLCFLPFRARIAISIASALYQRIGLSLKNASFQYWKLRAFVSVNEKVLMSALCIITKLLDKDFYFYLHGHKPHLHHSIRNYPYANTAKI
jgi:phytoene synthase